MELSTMPGFEPVEKFPFEALSNYVVIRVEEPQERIQNGVVIPKTVKQLVINAEVVAVSNEKEKDGTPMVRTVKVGDSVIFDVRVGQMISIADREYLVLRETDIFGILTKGEGGAIMVAKNSQPSNIIKPRHS